MRSQTYSWGSEDLGEPGELEGREEQDEPGDAAEPAPRDEEDAGAGEVDAETDGGQPVRRARRLAALQQEATPAAVMMSAKAGSMWPTARTNTRSR